jgi:hypothetical protein
VVYTETLVKSILYHYYECGLTCREIGDLVNIRKEHIQSMVSGKIWYSVFEEYKSRNHLWFTEVRELLSKRRGNNVKQIKEEFYELQKRMAQTSN